MAWAWNCASINHEWKWLITITVWCHSNLDEAFKNLKTTSSLLGNNNKYGNIFYGYSYLLSFSVPGSFRGHHQYSIIVLSFLYLPPLIVSHSWSLLPPPSSFSPTQILLHLRSALRLTVYPLHLLVYRWYAVVSLYGFRKVWVDCACLAFSCLELHRSFSLYPMCMSNFSNLWKMMLLVPSE